MNTSISQNEPQLCVKNRGAQIINKQEQDNRQKLFTEAIISHTEKIHFKFIQKLSETEIVDPIFNDLGFCCRVGCVSGFVERWFVL